MVKQKVIIFLPLIFFLHSSAQHGRDNFISTHDAAQRYRQKDQRPLLVVFPEIKEAPIKWDDSLNLKWLKNNYTVRPYILNAQPGEYFVFQVGAWAIDQDVKNVEVHLSDLKGDDGKMIIAGKITCFNTGGINYQGNPFTKNINIPAEKVLALWIGMDIPTTANGAYNGTISVSAHGNISKSIKIKLIAGGIIQANHGFDEGKSLSRLAWLNSTAGIDNKITKGYIPVSRLARTINILGRSMKIAGNGLPEKITTYFSPSNQSVLAKGEDIIAAPFHFIIEKENGEIIYLDPGKLQFTQQTPSGISWKVTNTSAECNVVCSGKLAFDGFADFQLKVKAKKAIHIKDIRLEVSMDKEKASHMMGLNREGGLSPKDWQWKWDSAKNQDALWTGAVNGGLRIKWKAENYVRPLVNIYYSFGPLHLPPSWSNDGRGGVHIYEKEKTTIVNAYSGGREMKKNEELNYDFELLITPFKIMDKEIQFADRYYHSDKDESASFISAADSLGANIINVHHKKDIYPYINYPYADINVGGIKSFIDKAHKDDKRVKLYYTTRELTTNLPELWAFKSLGGEVIYPGPGNDAKTLIHPNGPDQWLKDNLRKNYIPAWVADFTTGKYAGTRDLSVITTPDS
ncbi:MAG: glycoside hydrolase domain-containing protein, partial [Ginsengibacter sp.]